jgi:putative endonuclease
MDRSDRRAAQQRGVHAERLVEEELTALGWRVLARNFEAAGAELDLVVERQGAIRFVEVKARTDAFIDALESITPDKRRRLIRAARAWMADHPAILEAAFMIAVVHCEALPWTVELLDDPFDA